LAEFTALTLNDRVNALVFHLETTITA